MCTSLTSDDDGHTSHEADEHLPLAMTPTGGSKAEFGSHLRHEGHMDGESKSGANMSTAGAKLSEMSVSASS